MTNKEAIKKLKEILFMTGYEEAIDLAIKALEQQLECGCNTCEYYPMKDQRPQGEWILNKDENPECPFCHHSFTYWSNFCSNCGATMQVQSRDVNNEETKY